MKKFLILVLSLLLVFPTSIYAKEVEKKEDVKVEEKEEVKKDEEKELTLNVTLESCVDGDTANFRTESNTVIKARFLAIDTPETVHPTSGKEPFGEEASKFTCDSLTNAKEIKLEYDVDSKEEDNYGRKLVWVFVDNVLLQNKLIEKGYAEVAYLYGDYKYTTMLQETERKAKQNKVGIWSIDNTSVKEEVEEKEEKDTNDGLIDKIVDKLFAKIVGYIDEILENILISIEEML